MTDNQFAQQFETAAEKIKATEAFRRDFMQSALRDYEMKEQAREEGRQVEREKAEAEKVEIVNKMLNDGISVEIISKYTNFSISKINSLE